MITTDQATARRDDLGVDLLADRGGQQLGVVEPRRPGRACRRAACRRPPPAARRRRPRPASSAPATSAKPRRRSAPSQAHSPASRRTRARGGLNGSVMAQRRVLSGRGAVAGVDVQPIASSSTTGIPISSGTVYGARLPSPPKSGGVPRVAHRSTGQMITNALPITLSDRDGALVGVVDVGPRVRRLVPVVAHHPEVPGRHGHRPERLLVELRVGRVHVRLVERPAVDGDPALLVAALHGLAADRDHPLDEVLLARRGHPERARPPRAAPSLHRVRRLLGTRSPAPTTPGP